MVSREQSLIGHSDRAAGPLASSRAFLLLELVLAMVLVSVALVGLVDAFRTSSDVYHANASRSQAWMLLEAKLADLDDGGVFREGEHAGAFSGHDAFSWKMVAATTVLPSLWRMEVEVTGGGASVRGVAYLQAKEP